MIVPKSQNSCSDCSMLELCMPIGLPHNSIDKLNTLVFSRIKIKAGENAYIAGNDFQSLYAIKTGSMKVLSEDEDGREQINGFFMMGEIIGFDGISTDKHSCTAKALEDTVLCKIPLDNIEVLNQKIQGLQSHFMRLMSREIVRDHTIMMVLGNMNTEEKVAAFLINLAHRLNARGYSPTEFILRMKREEIANYLGLTIESISRTLTVFKQLGLISAHQKQIKIIDPNGLQKIIGIHSCK